MRKLTVALATLIFMSVGATAHAGGYGGHGGHWKHNHWKNAGHWKHAGHWKRGGHWKHGRHWRPGGHLGLHYGFHGRAGDVLGVIAGGILLGSILDYAFSPRYNQPAYSGDYRYRSPRRYQEPARTTYTTRPVYREVVTHRVYRPAAIVPQRTHLHRDRYGNCFEVSYGGDGGERRRELPASSCHW